MKYSEALIRAKSLRGQTENPPNSNRVPFIDIVDKTWWLGFSRQGNQWCGTFVDYVLGQDMLPSTMYTVITGMDYFKQAGRWKVHNPNPGDVVFETFDHSGLPGHVEWCERVEGDKVITWGGNTTPGVGGDQANGGGVFQRVRIAANIVGYGVINYDPEQEDEDDMPMSMCRKTSTGEINVFGSGGRWKVKSMAILRKWQTLGILVPGDEPWIEMTDDEFDSIPEIKGI